MRMVVLGAGLQGSACAFDLLRNEAVERVVVADLAVDEPPAFLAEKQGDPRLELRTLDARDDDAVLDLLRGSDAVLNALPYYLNLDITRLAVEAGVHYADLGGNTDIVFEQMKLDEQARERGVSVVPDTGLAPGMVNILAAAGIAELDHAESVKLFVGGLPQQPEGPLNYQVVYSLAGVLDYYTSSSWIVRDGHRQNVEALSEVETVSFGDGIGQLEAFHTAGGLSTMPWDYEDIPNMEYKTLRYPGHAHIVRAMRELGLFDLEPVQVGDVRVAPRDVFIATAGPRLTRPEGRDLVALRVEVSGTRGGAPGKVVYDLLDYRNDDTGVSAMERTTGYTLSITGQLQVAGRTTGPGVKPAHLALPLEPYLAELGKRNIRIQRRTL
ncbi:MAG: saccharopine dehydrogenase C-terminal domain-containing protein [Gemmatimonadota bacterium]